MPVQCSRRSSLVCGMLRMAERWLGPCLWLWLPSTLLMLVETEMWKVRFWLVLNNTPCRKSKLLLPSLNLAINLAFGKWLPVPFLPQQLPEEFSFSGKEDVIHNQHIFNLQSPYKLLDKRCQGILNASINQNRQFSTAQNCFPKFSTVTESSCDR